MTVLLSSKAFIGIEECFALISEANVQLEVQKRGLIADLINAACAAVERYIQAPVVYTQFKEYYYGQPTLGGTGGIRPLYSYSYLTQTLRLESRLWLEQAPVVIDSPDHPFLLKVRSVGNSLDATASPDWTTWTRDNDFVVDLSRGLLTVNPAQQTIWPAGYHNVYVEYWAGYGKQKLDDENEVIGSTAPDDIRFATKLLVEHWYRRTIADYSQGYLEQQPRGQNPSILPDDVTMLLSQYTRRRPFRSILA